MSLNPEASREVAQTPDTVRQAELNHMLNGGLVDPQPFADQLATELGFKNESVFGPNSAEVRVAQYAGIATMSDTSSPYGTLMPQGSKLTGDPYRAAREREAGKTPVAQETNNRAKIGGDLQQIVYAFQNPNNRMRIGTTGSDVDVARNINALVDDFNRGVWTKIHDNKLRAIQEQLGMQ